MADKNVADDELRDEYEPSLFAHAERGKYAARFQAGTNIVRLAPDVAAAFPNEESVNEALRFVQRIAKDANRLTAPRS